MSYQKNWNLVSKENAIIRNTCFLLNKYKSFGYTFSALLPLDGNLKKKFPPFPVGFTLETVIWSNFILHNKNTLTLKDNGKNYNLI